MTEQHGTYHPTRRAADPIDTDATASGPTGADQNATDLTGADQTAIDPAATDLTYTDPTASDPTATGPTATEPANTNPTPAGPASDPESAAPARQQAPGTDTAPSEGLGDAPEEPIVSLPPIAAELAGYPLSKRTGEPRRPPVIVGAVAAFTCSAVVAVVTYWWYWWVAIHIENFATSSKLIELFDPRPGSGSSVVLVCVMAIIGVIMTAGPALAGYNAWHGALWSRFAGFAACATSLLAFFMIPWSWLALIFAAIGTGLIWLPQAKRYFDAYDHFANPPRPAIVPKTKVAYGPAPRFR